MNEHRYPMKMNACTSSFYHRLRGDTGRFWIWSSTVWLAAMMLFVPTPGHSKTLEPILTKENMVLPTDKVSHCAIIALSPTGFFQQDPKINQKIDPLRQAEKIVAVLESSLRARGIEVERKAEAELASVGTQATIDTVVTVELINFGYSMWDANKAQQKFRISVVRQPDGRKAGQLIFVIGWRDSESDDLKLPVERLADGLVNENGFLRHSMVEPLVSRVPTREILIGRWMYESSEFRQTFEYRADGTFTAGTIGVDAKTKKQSEESVSGKWELKNGETLIYTDIVSKNKRQPKKETSYIHLIEDEPDLYLGFSLRKGAVTIFVAKRQPDNGQ